MRRARRTDGNHASIRNALRGVPGVEVEDTSDVGRGFPDLIARFRGGPVALLEIKDPSQPPSARELTPAEKRFAERFKGAYHVVLSLDDALAAIGVTRKAG